MSDEPNPGDRMATISIGVKRATTLAAAHTAVQQAQSVFSALVAYEMADRPAGSEIIGVDPTAGTISFQLPPEDDNVES
jgi:hypothetical protein